MRQRLAWRQQRDQQNCADDPRRNAVQPCRGSSARPHPARNLRAAIIPAPPQPAPSRNVRERRCRSFHRGGDFISSTPEGTIEYARCPDSKRFFGRLSLAGHRPNVDIRANTAISVPSRAAAREFGADAGDDTRRLMPSRRRFNRHKPRPFYPDGERARSPWRLHPRVFTVKSWPPCPAPGPCARTCP